eukprot:c24339_g5_i2 orf=62-310(-)
MECRSKSPQMKFIRVRELWVTGYSFAYAMDTKIIAHAVMSFIKCFVEGIHCGVGEQVLSVLWILALVRVADANVCLAPAAVY